MQRIDPRPEPAAARNDTEQPDGSRPAGPLPTGFASTGANPHTQTFEEIYAEPENFLEIEVCIWCYLHFDMADRQDR